MKTRLHSIRMKLAFALFSAVAAVNLQGADGFVPLFDGRSLAGWVNVNCAPETWTITNGLLHCTGVPTGVLRSERQYENFILELEWRHLKPRGNAGVFVWAGPLPAEGQPFLRAVEVQVLENGYGQTENYTTHGDIFPIHGSTMKPFAPNRGQRSFPKERHSKPAPEWNHYRVICSNGVIRLSVNGHEVSGGTDCQWRKGYLALESEGGQVDWRNLRIQELPSTGAGAEDTAPTAEPFVSLYDGLSLRGWQLSSAATNHWRVSDWTLRCTGASASDTLWSERRVPGDFEFFFDWLWPEEPSEKVAPIVFRTAEGKRVEITLPPLPAAKVKGWNRLQCRRTGTRLSLTLNDQPAGELTIASGVLEPGLRTKQPTQFANVFLK